MLLGLVFGDNDLGGLAWMGFELCVWFVSLTVCLGV